MVRVAVCQMTSRNDIRANLEKIEDTVRSVGADLYVFPEMFLTCYGARIPDSDTLDEALGRLCMLSKDTDSAFAVGMPRRDNGLVFNSMVFVTPERIRTYDKIHLANFGDYDESAFSPGKEPVIVEWKGMRFGLLICYDLLFPELSRYYAVNGADAILMASASATSSEHVMKTMLPARSLENTVYLVFCNNIGKFGNGLFFGGSSVYSPTGEIIAETSSEEGIIVVDLKPEIIQSAREKRPHLRDRRVNSY